MDIYIPPYDQLMNPVLQALHALGGSGTIEEINLKASEVAHLSDEQTEVLHNPNRGSETEVDYRFAWARTYLKKYGILENSSRGVWSLSSEARNIMSVDPQEVRRFVRKQSQNSLEISEDDNETEQELSWREELIEILLDIDPAAFERLIQRMLREAGFIQVEVTGRSGDRGIDGKGLMRLGGLLSFHVMFQCKRYKGSVSSGEIRDFRGALVGRADKGLFVTTGNFTRGAVEEATRDGAPAIDLIDGDQLVEKLKELDLGVKTELVTVEKVTINRDWFSKI